MKFLGGEKNLRDDRNYRLGKFSATRNIAALKIARRAKSARRKNLALSFLRARIKSRAQEKSKNYLFARLSPSMNLTGKVSVFRGAECFRICSKRISVAFRPIAMSGCSFVAKVGLIG